MALDASGKEQMRHSVEMVFEEYQKHPHYQNAIRSLMQSEHRQKAIDILVDHLTERYDEYDLFVGIEAKQYVARIVKGHFKQSTADPAVHLSNIQQAIEHHDGAEIAEAPETKAEAIAHVDDGMGATAVHPELADNMQHTPKRGRAVARSEKENKSDFHAHNPMEAEEIPQKKQRTSEEAKENSFNYSNTDQTRAPLHFLKHTLSWLKKLLGLEGAIGKEEQVVEPPPSHEAEARSRADKLLKDKAKSIRGSVEAEKENMTAQAPATQHQQKQRIQ